MNATRQIVLDVLDQLGEDATLDQVLYHLHVRRKIEAGLEDMEAGRTHSSDDVRRRIAQWSEKSGGPTEH